jgi:hypothetical protein
VNPRPKGQRRGGRPPPRARGQPLVEHFDLRGATARQVQALRFVEVARWFPSQRDTRASEGFYTPLHEDFYRAYVDNGIAFRPQRVCRLESLVVVIGEQLCPHISFLPGLSDLLGRTVAYYGTWVREFYSSLWIDPAHEFIHFAFRGRDHRLYNTRVREILRIPASETKIYQLCFGQTPSPRHPHGGTVPHTDLVRSCFCEPFGEGSRRIPTSFTPIARVLDAIMRRTLLPRLGYREGLTRMQLCVVYHLIS